MPNLTVELTTDELLLLRQALNTRLCHIIDKGENNWSAQWDEVAALSKKLGEKLHA